MNPATESLLDRVRSAHLPQVIIRYLTPISIGVLVVGVALVLAGPVRSLLGLSAASGGGSSSASSQQTVVGSASSDQSTIDQMARSVVPFTIIPDRPRNQVVSYTIKRGDTLFGIAGQFGLKPETIFWSNKGTLSDDIHLILPDVTIAIMPVNGVYIISDGTRDFEQIAHDYSQTTTVDPNAIINSPYNNFAGKTPKDIPAWGTPVVVPGGSSTIISWKPPLTVTVNKATGQAVYGFMQGMPGSCSSGIHGGGGSGAWIPPVSPGSYTVTQPFAPWHSGIDLAAVLGTAAHAADAGVVVYSGWVPQSWGYGQLVVLDHGNNWTTYYAHLNAINVHCGQSVARGEVVGEVGTTGNSTGTHLHFEMRWNNTPDNPAAYIGL